MTSDIWTSFSHNQQFSLFPKVINGGVAGIVGVSCLFPLDLVKTRLQNQQVGPNGEMMYSSMRDCFKKTFKSEGYSGLYRGIYVNLLLIAPEKAVQLSANDLFRHKLTLSDGTLPVHREMLAGACAGLCQVTVTNPMELIKIQLQDAGRKNQPNISALSVSEQLLSSKGILGLYRGFSGTMLRDIPFAIIYFTLFANIRDQGPRQSPESPEVVFWWSFISGLVSGAVSSVTVNPADVVKTRLQLINKGPGEDTYTGIVDTFRKIYRKEGSRAFLKGALSRLLVIAPFHGIAQTVYFLGIAEYILGVKKKTQ